MERGLRMLIDWFIGLIIGIGISILAKILYDGFFAMLPRELYEILVDLNVKMAWGTEETVDLQNALCKIESTRTYKIGRDFELNRFKRYLRVYILDRENNKNSDVLLEWDRRICREYMTILLNRGCNF